MREEGESERGTFFAQWQTTYEPLLPAPVSASSQVPLSGSLWGPGAFAAFPLIWVRQLRPVAQFAPLIPPLCSFWHPPPEILPQWLLGRNSLTTGVRSSPYFEKLAETRWRTDDFWNRKKGEGAPERFAYFALKTIDFSSVSNGEVDAFCLENI